MPGLYRTRWDLGLAVKFDHDDLATAVEKAMPELRDDGTIAQIFSRFGLTYHPPSQVEVSSVQDPSYIKADSYTVPPCR